MQSDEVLYVWSMDSNSNFWLILSKLRFPASVCVRYDITASTADKQLFMDLFTLLHGWLEEWRKVKVMLFN